MNKRQKKKLEDKKNIEKLQSESEGVNARLETLEIGFNVIREVINGTIYSVDVNRDNIKSLLSTIDYMERQSGARMKELEEKHDKLKEENSILIEEQEKQSKRITGVYIMILVVVLLEVVQWWILHA